MTRVSIRADGLAGTAERLADQKPRWQAISDAGRENARRHGSSKQMTGQSQEVEVCCFRNLLTANQGHSARCNLRTSPSLGELVMACLASPRLLPAAQEQEAGTGLTKDDEERDKSAPEGKPNL